MNIIGDIYAYWGGGCEMVGTCKSNASSVVDRAKVNFVDIYLEPEQKKWAYETDSVRNNLGTFGFEKAYSKIGTFGPPMPNNSYVKNRKGFTPWPVEIGGNLANWQCYYGNVYPYWSSTIDQRARIALRFRGDATNANCSARYLIAHLAVSDSYVYYGGSAQCRIVQ